MRFFPHFLAFIFFSIHIYFVFWIFFYINRQTQMLRVAILKVNLSEHGLYVSVYQVFLPSNKIFICVVCFRN